MGTGDQCPLYIIQIKKKRIPYSTPRNDKNIWRSSWQE